MNNKLPIEIKQEWLSALRSGTYEQTTDRLQRDGQYCCLGVLCDILKDKLQLKWEPTNDYFFYKVMRIEDGIAILPTKVAEYCNIERDPLVNNSRLSRLNDKGFTFEEIANIIEEHL